MNYNIISHQTDAGSWCTISKRNSNTHWLGTNSKIKRNTTNKQKQKE